MQVIPEKINNNNDTNYWERKLNNGNVEKFNKDFFNSDFTRKENRKQKLIEEIENLITA
jgi:hypothetical protein